MAAAWKETTSQTICSNYETCNIYSTNEFGFFYLASKTLNLKKEKCAGGRHNKVRLTGLDTAIMDGRKLLVFVIDKYEKPCCLKAITKLPIPCRGQRKVG